MTSEPTVYLDNGATTKVDSDVANAALSAMIETFGNPSSAHQLGALAHRRLEVAREQVAHAIGAEPSELIFTSGGTEANALGFYGAARLRPGKPVVLSALEHPSIADAARRLAEEGHPLVIVPATSDGRVDLAAWEQAIDKETAVATLLFVQNEIGTVQPIALAARLLRARAPRCHLHVDAVQAIGKLPVDVGSLGIDSLSLSAHKLHGPKGAGALWLKKGGRLEPRVYGGGQERGLRPGTEAVPALVALGLAVERAEAARPLAAPEMARLRELLWQRLMSELPGKVVRHGDPAHAAPHILSVGFAKTPAEPLLHALESRGVYVSAGSACHSKARKPSATLLALKIPEDMGTLRFSLSRFTTEAEIGRAAEAAKDALSEIAR